MEYDVIEITMEAEYEQETGEKIKPYVEFDL
jgi:hypothetical protein